MAKKEQENVAAAPPEHVLPGTEIAIPTQAHKANIEAGELIEMAEVLDISSPEEFQKANEYRQAALKLEKEIESAFDPIVDAAHKAHKAATTTRARFLDQVLRAKNLIANKMAAWQSKERARVENERREAENKRRAEAEEQRKREVESLREQGEESLAQVVESTPVVIAEETIAPVKAEGFSAREDWDFRVIDIKKLNPEFLMANETKIRAIVKSMKMDAHTIVGAGSIQIVKKDVPVNRG